EQHGRRGGAGSQWLGADADRSRGWGLGRFIVVIFFQDGKALSFRQGGAVGGLLTRRHEDSADEEDCGEAAENPPAIFLQGIGSVDGRSEASAGEPPPWLVCPSSAGAASVPSPESLNARAWPNPALEATSTLASGWPG